ADLASARRLIGWDGLLLVAAIVFAAGLVLGGAIFTSNRPQDAAEWLAFVFQVALLLVVACGASYFINVNRYSLHSLYRNRLVRVFLGASRAERDTKPSVNRFTDFASDDSPLVFDLWKRGLKPSRDNWQPLHIINTTLNLQSSRNPAWQERRAASFTI